jgi:hypothetical protein
MQISSVTSIRRVDCCQQRIKFGRFVQSKNHVQLLPELIELSLR